jgi:hypothetical protein
MREKIEPEEVALSNQTRKGVRKLTPFAFADCLSKLV